MIILSINKVHLHPLSTTLSTTHLRDYRNYASLVLNLQNIEENQVLYTHIITGKSFLPV